MTTDKTKIMIRNITIAGDAGQYVGASATIVETQGLRHVSFPELSITLTPAEGQELKALTDRIVRRTIEEIRQNF